MFFWQFFLFVIRLHTEKSAKMVDFIRTVLPYTVAFVIFVRTFLNLNIFCLPLNYCATRTCLLKLRICGCYFLFSLNILTHKRMYHFRLYKQCGNDRKTLLVTLLGMTIQPRKKRRKNLLIEYFGSCLDMLEPKKIITKLIRMS